MSISCWVTLDGLVFFLIQVWRPCLRDSSKKCSDDVWWSNNLRFHIGKFRPAKCGSGKKIDTYQHLSKKCFKKSIIIIITITTSIIIILFLNYLLKANHLYLKKHFEPTFLDEKTERAWDLFNKTASLSLLNKTEEFSLTVWTQSKCKGYILFPRSPGLTNIMNVM